MTVRSAITAQLGCSEEVSYGTPLAPTRWFPFVPPIGIKYDSKALESESVYAGRRAEMEAQRAVGGVAVGGPLNFELMDKNTGLLLKHCLGGVSTTGPNLGFYDHTFTMGELTGKSLCWQAGKTQSGDGTVQPFTWSGGKVVSWELAGEANKIAKLAIEFLFKDEILLRSVTDGVTTNGSPTVTSATAAFSVADIGKPISGTNIPAGSYIGRVNSATSIDLSSSHSGAVAVNATGSGTGVTLTVGLALATPSYPTPMQALTMVDGFVTIGGSTVKTKAFKIGGDNGLADDREFIGQRTIDEPLEAGDRPITGQIDTEFFDLVQYNRFRSHVPATLVARFRAPMNTPYLELTANVRFSGESQEIGDKEIIGQPLPFEVLGAATDASALSILYKTADATP